MKKLRVILPAILTLAVSTSAAVTGTVAWFTATRLRQVNMNNVAVVDPEQGLDLELVENLGGTIIDEATVNPSTHVPVNSQTPIVKHAYYKAGEPAEDTKGYFRDGSVDVKNGVVYKGVLDDTGNQPTTFETVTTPYADATRTFNDKNVYHATAFKMTFSVEDNSSEVYEHSLFLDINHSTATLDSTGKGANDDKLYKALRFGFISGDEWFVWAPFSDLAATAAKYIAVDANDIDSDENTTELIATPYAEANWVAGNAADANPSTPNPALVEAANGYITSAVGTGKNYVGYLGKLEQYDTADPAKNGTEVTVYTWFEGTDDNCISEYFEKALPGVTSNLRFVMRKVAK